MRQNRIHYMKLERTEFMWKLILHSQRTHSLYSTRNWSLYGSVPLNQILTYQRIKLIWQRWVVSMQNETEYDQYFRKIYDKDPTETIVNNHDFELDITDTVSNILDRWDSGGWISKKMSIHVKWRIGGCEKWNDLQCFWLTMKSAYSRRQLGYYNDQSSLNWRR